MIRSIKKIIGFLCSLVFCTVIAVGMPQMVRAADVTIDETNFPDKTFRNYVSNQFDTDSSHGLSEEEIANITHVIVGDENIINLKGIEYFTALTYLYCCNTNITSLNLENNTALTELWCGYAKLTSLDLERNTALKTLYCQCNRLTSLDLRSNTTLDTLYCHDNKLTNLDLRSNTALRVLNCCSNKITSLNLGNNITLEYLYCHNNQLTNLDLGSITTLAELMCYNNKLTELKLNSQTYDKLSLSTNSLHGDSANLSDLQNVTKTTSLKVTDITKPATYKVNGKDFTIIYSDTVVMPSASPSAEPNPSPSPAPSASPSPAPSLSPSPAHIFIDYGYTSPVTGSSIIYGNGINKKINGTRALTLYTDILASYKYTLSSNGTVKPSASKVIVAVTKTNVKPEVNSRNKVTDTSASKIARAKIKNGQITVTAVGKEGGLVYLWVIDTGSKGVSASCPIDVKLAPKKLEVQSTSGTKLTNTKLQNGTTLDVHITGLAGTSKTEDCTYTATVGSKYQLYVHIAPNGTTDQDFTITAKCLKNNKDTKAIITFTCDQNGKKVKFSLTITK